MKFKIEQLFTTKVLEGDPKLLKLDKDFISHALPYLAAIPLKFFTTNELRDALLTDYPVESSFTKVKTDSSVIRALYTILGKYPLSDYSSVGQTKQTSFSSAVPFGMLAYKQFFGIPYSEWDLDNEAMISRIMGHSFRDLLEVREKLKDLWDDRELRLEWRNEVLAGGLIKDIAWNIDSKKVEVDVPRFYKAMLTQTWIFSPSIRHENMITNLSNFDYVDPPLVEVSEDLFSDKW